MLPRPIVMIHLVMATCLDWYAIVAEVTIEEWNGN